MNDVWQFSGIEVTGQGRVAAKAGSPTIAINIANINVLFEQMEREIDLMEVDEEVKEEAKSKLRVAADAVGDIGKVAVGETLAAAFRHTLGLP